MRRYSHAAKEHFNKGSSLHLRNYWQKKKTKKHHWQVLCMERYVGKTVGMHPGRCGVAHSCSLSVTEFRVRSTCKDIECIEINKNIFCGVDCRHQYLNSMSQL